MIETIICGAILVMLLASQFNFLMSLAVCLWIVAGIIFIFIVERR